MNKNELEKLKNIIEKRFWGPDFAKNLSTAEYIKKIKKWEVFCEEMGIRRASSLTSIICVELQSTDIRIIDPTGCQVIFTEEEAKKILVLGL